MTLEEKLEQLKKLIVERDRVTEEIKTLIGFDDDDRPKKKGGAPRGTNRTPANSSKSRYAGHSCCGSKGPRHLASCSSIGDPKSDDRDDGDVPNDLPVHKTGRAKRYACTACYYEFRATEKRACPECGEVLTVEK